MNLTSLVFLFFCFFTIIIYFVVPKKVQWVILLISSYIFLFYKNLNVFSIIQALIVLVSSYVFGLLVEKHNEVKERKKFLLIGILIIFGQLLYLKYTNFFLITLNYIFKLFNINYEFNLVYRNCLIGISYYSLIMISYLIDIYRGACKAQKNFFKCALFMSYFPVLTSGPFIRYADIEKDLYGNHKFNYHDMCSGLLRICWGIFKIIVISARIGFFVDTVYGNLSDYYGGFVLVAILLFPLQLYTNFSGSIDIIMGISEIIGINLPENFKTPFFAKTMTEFWRKWHITLGLWLKEYIFYPLLKSDKMQQLNKRCQQKLGKKIGKKIPLYISMLVMWLFIGIWHGGSYTFIVGSGLLQFLFIFFEDILKPVASKVNEKLGINTTVFSYKLYQVIRTYLLFSFAMIFFRATSLTHSIEIIHNLFKWNPWVLFDNESIYTAGLDLLDFRILFIGLIILFIVERLISKGNIREKLFEQNIVFRWGIIYALIFFIIIFGCYGVGYDPTAFIYGKF